MRSDPRLVRALGLALAGLAPGIAGGCGPAGGFAPDPSFRQQSWTQGEPTPVDVLWVVDTSCSMLDEQQELVDNFPSFIDFFVRARLEFHLGVTTTNIGEDGTDGLDGHLSGDPGVLTDGTADVAQAFLDRALLGIDEGHGDEKGLEAAFTALGELGATANAGLVRPDANLAVIVVSDEPDYSERGEPGSDDVIHWEAFAEWLDGFKGPAGEGRSQLSALVGIGPGGFDDPEGCGGAGQHGEGAERGTGYLEAARATGGAWQSICSADWAELLGRLGLLVAGLDDAFVLDEVPLPGTVHVLVDAAPVIDWEYVEAENTVRFTRYEAIPSPGARIEVEYHVALP